MKSLLAALLVLVSTCVAETPEWAGSWRLNLDTQAKDLKDILETLEKSEREVTLELGKKRAIFRQGRTKYFLTLKKVYSIKDKKTVWITVDKAGSEDTLVYDAQAKTVTIPYHFSGTEFPLVLTVATPKKASDKLEH